MERDGLLSRKVSDAVPARVEHSLTELGKGFIEPIERLDDRGRRHAAALYRPGRPPRSRRAGPAAKGEGPGTPG